MRKVYKSLWTDDEQTSFWIKEQGSMLLANFNFSKSVRVYMYISNSST